VEVILAGGAITTMFITVPKFVKKNKVKEFKNIRDHIKDKRRELQNSTVKVVEPGLFKSSKFKLSEEIPLFVLDGWIKEFPISLDEIKIKPGDDVVPKGKLTEAAQKFEYSDMIKKHDKPKIFTENDQYRLLDVTDDTLVFSKSKYNYFDKINYGGFLEFDLAKNDLAKKQKAKLHRDTVINNISKPSDYIILTGVNTLTVLVDGNKLRLLMHQRSKKTGTSMNTFHVIPAGEFQPASNYTTAWENDFYLFKNILRETAEEIALVKETDGNNHIEFKYDTPPYSEIINEKDKGNVKFFYLGIGLDVLTLQGEILTCAVYKKDTFDRLFPNIIHENPEGTIINDVNAWGKEYDEIYWEPVASYLRKDTNTLAAARALLHLFRKHKDFFLHCLDKA
jgi:hypothetical protein